MKDTIVRPYRPGDESGILILYREVFHVNLSLEMWEWFYQKVPEKATIVVIAENDDGIVGHYGIQPRPFWLGGQPCLAGLTVGTMVHPSARNLTTLVEMATMAYDISRKEGLLFLYSFSRDEAWKVRQDGKLYLKSRHGKERYLLRRVLHHCQWRVTQRFPSRQYLAYPFPWMEKPFKVLATGIRQPGLTGVSSRIRRSLINFWL
jgi:hypothetical protein